MNQATLPRVLFTCFGLVIALSFGAPQTALAEEDSGTYLEEIIVTGTKRAASQQDTPIAISTITANQIAKTFGNDIRDIGDLSPNVNLTQQTGFNAVAGGIRGTGTISILTTQDPSVGILIDEFALNHVQTQFVELFDLEQVEVYRGPQGTLFGKNSTGGTIAFTSKRPNLDEFGGTAQVTAGGYDGGSTNYKAQLGLDIPIIEGVLGFRFAGSIVDEEGYYTNDKDTATFPNSPVLLAAGIPLDQLDQTLVNTPTVGDGGRIGGKHVMAAKSKLLWQPNDRYEAYFVWEVLRDDSDSPANINETPAGEGFNFPQIGFPGIHEAGHSDVFSTGITNQGDGIDMRDGHQVDVDGYYLHQQLNFDNFHIKSVTGIREQSEILPSSYSGEAYLSLFDASRNLEREQFQQELRFVTEMDGPLNFVAGGIYITDDVDMSGGRGSTGYVPVLIMGIYAGFGIGGEMDKRIITDHGTGVTRQDRESWAVYTDGTYQFNDQFSITAGVRYTKDKKHFFKLTGSGAPCNEFTPPQDQQIQADGSCFDPNSTRISRVGLTSQEAPNHGQILPDEQYRLKVDERSKWNETTWRVVMDYKPTDDQLWYAGVSTGFLAGGYSETCSQPVTCIPYDPETNINYEGGFKGDLLDGRLRLNAAVFYTDFDDLQRNQVFRFDDPITGTPGQETITLNAGKSHAFGVEVETTWLLTDRFQLRASVGYLDAQYDEFEFEGLDLTSLDIPFASKWQIGAQGIYDQMLGNGAALTYVVSAHFQTDAEMSPFDPNAATGLNPKFPGFVARHPTYTQLEERTLVDASITYTSANEKYWISLWGKNLLNEKYRTSANSVGALWNFSHYGAPLKWGVELGINFE
ncbi:MAG: TonB-dependent receptor [Gammaproteobacteria bacterium]|nr:TonB-dependent receptor [Gammaproteobacteria bacterium]|tara:strand:+ start:3785 stop:6361 length:2577 start_codon:yes stop_codon:yes gene_type:complete